MWKGKVARSTSWSFRLIYRRASRPGPSATNVEHALAHLKPRGRNQMTRERLEERDPMNRPRACTGTRSSSRRATGFTAANRGELAPKLANTFLLSLQKTHVPTFQAFLAADIRARVMTPSFAPAVSTTVRESHGARRDRAVRTNLPLAPRRKRRPERKRMGTVSRRFLWAVLGSNQ